MTGQERIQEILRQIGGLGVLWQGPICNGYYLDPDAFPDAVDGQVVVSGRVCLGAAGAFCPADTEYIDGPQGYWWNDQILRGLVGHYVHVVLRVTGGCRVLEVVVTQAPPPRTGPIE